MATEAFMSLSHSKNQLITTTQNKPVVVQYCTMQNCTSMSFTRGGVLVATCNIYKMKNRR